MRALCGDGGEWLEFADVGRGVFRAARLDDDRLTAVLLVAPDAGRLPEREALGGLFALQRISAPLRLGLLSGRSVAAGPSAGRTLCACLGIGEGRIRQAIREDGLASVEAVGESLGAGTGCGSCIPELRMLLAKEVGEHGPWPLHRSTVR